jgi:hypothetical protein
LLLAKDSSDRDSMTTTLVTAIGFNPASVLCAAQALGVSQAILICTRETREVALVVASQIRPVRSELLECAHSAIGPAMELLTTSLRASITEQDKIVLDITGATKPIAIATWQALHNVGRAPDSIVYLSPEGQLYDATTGTQLRYPFEVTPEQMLGWRGMSVSSSVAVGWRGTLATLPTGYRTREELSRWLFALTLAESEGTTGMAHYQGARFHPRGRTDCPAAWDISADGLLSPPADQPRYFEKHSWLEELALIEARIAVNGHAASIKAIHSLTTHPVDEFDVVLMRGPRVVVIETKAGQAVYNPDIHQRAQKVARAFGPVAQLIFWQPARGASISPELVGLVGDRVLLVGSDLSLFHRAIRRALGLA